jgi:very-short-patch-repair endonuclease
MTPSPPGPSPYRERGDSPQLKEARRRLRQEQTEAERVLWKCLRSRKLSQYKFRRQHPIATYIADFCCLEAKLVIELDGASHVGRRKEDLNRTEVLENFGFRVVRFWNNEIIKHPEVVIKKILEMMGDESHLPAKESSYHWRH